MRKVAWDRGPVRLGTLERADGAQIPLWHDSEVAAMAYAIQNIIAQRQGAAVTEPDHKSTSGPAEHAMGGKKCQECGAQAVIKRDGCEHCSACGWLGSCG